MGWRRNMITVTAAVRRAAKEQERAQRQAQRERERSLRDAQAQLTALMARADSVDADIRRDPIAGLRLSYAGESRGIAAPPDEHGITNALVPERIPAPAVVLHAGDAVRLTLLDLRVVPHGVVAAFGVEARETARLDFIRQKDPSKSPLFLVDPTAGTYVYPRGTTLPGNVVPGAPTTGLVLFDALRRPARALELHALDAKLGSDVARFAHTYAPPWLEYESGSALHAPTVRQIVEQRLREAAAAQAEAQRLANIRRAEEDAARNALILKVVGGLFLLGVVIIASCVICVASVPDPPTPAAKPPTTPPPAATAAAPTPKPSKPRR